MIRAGALRKESAAARHIPYAAHIAEDLIITRSGDYVQTLKIAGASFSAARPRRPDTNPRKTMSYTVSTLFASQPP